LSLVLCRSGNNGRIKSRTGPKFTRSRLTNGTRTWHRVWTGRSRWLTVRRA